MVTARGHFRFFFSRCCCCWFANRRFNFWFQVIAVQLVWFCVFDFIMMALLNYSSAADTFVCFASTVSSNQNINKLVKNSTMRVEKVRIDFTIEMVDSAIKMSLLDSLQFEVIALQANGSFYVPVIQYACA